MACKATLCLNCEERFVHRSPRVTSPGDIRVTPTKHSRKPATFDILEQLESLRPKPRMYMVRPGFLPRPRLPEDSLFRRAAEPSPDDAEEPAEGSHSKLMTDLKQHTERTRELEDEMRSVFDDTINVIAEELENMNIRVEVLEKQLFSEEPAAQGEPEKAQKAKLSRSYE